VPLSPLKPQRKRAASMLHRQAATTHTGVQRRRGRDSDTTARRRWCVTQGVRYYTPYWRPSRGKPARGDAAACALTSSAARAALRRRRCGAGVAAPALPPSESHTSLSGVWGEMYDVLYGLETVVVHAPPPPPARK
jgi:hypothetical protein